MAQAFDAGTVSARLMLDLNQWTANIDKAKKDMSTFGGQVMSHEADIKKLGTTFTAVGVAITGAIGMMLKSATDYTLEIGRMSVRTGMTTETISGLREACEKSGISLDEMGVGMRRFSSLAADASSGNKAAADTLAKLGISAVDATGKLKPMDQLLFETADKFKAMPNGIEKSALAVDLFGRAGTMMIAIMNRGSEGLREFIDEQKDMGTQITSEGVAKAKAFSYSLMDLEHSMMAVKLAIANAIMPVVQALATAFTFVVTNVRKVMDIFPPLGSSITVIVGVFGALLAVIGPILFILPRLVSGWMQLGLLLPSLTGKVALFAKGFLGLMPLIAAGVVAIETVSWAFKKWHAVLDAEISKLQEVASQEKKTWEFIRATIHGATTQNSEAIKRGIARMREMGMSSEEIADAIYTQYGKIINQTKAVTTETKEMADKVREIQKEMTDKIKELTLNEFDYRIYQAARWRDDMKEKAKGSVDEAKLVAQAEKAYALEVAKVRSDQAKVGADAVIKQLDRELKAADDYFKKLMKYSGQELGSVMKENVQKSVSVKEMTSKMNSYFGDFAANTTLVAAKAKTGFLSNMKVTEQSFSTYLSTMQNGINSFFQAYQQLSEQRFKNEMSLLTSEYDRKKAAILAEKISEEDKQKALTELDTKFAADKKALEQKKLEQDKKASIVQAMMNLATAITASWKLGFPLGAIAAAIAAAACWIQIRAIKAQTVELAEGGIATRRTDAVIGEAGPEAVLPLKELGRMLGYKKSDMGGANIHFSISAIDTHGMDRFFSQSVVPRLRRALRTETLRVPTNAVR